MADLTWQDLMRCYDLVEFLGDGKGLLTIASMEVLDIIVAIEAAADTIAGDLNFYPTGGVARVAVRDRIEVNVGSPKLSIGILARDFDVLLSAPRGYVDFPPRFYVVDGRLSDRDTSPPLLK